MGIRSFFRGVWQKMFPLKSINQAIDINVLLTEEQWNNIIKWRNIYMGQADWNNKNTPSLNTAFSISKEIAMNSTIEFESNIEGNDFLNEQYQEVLKKLLDIVESVCWGGSIVLRPFHNNGKILVNIAEAGTFAPIKKDREGNITSAVFLEFQQKNDKFYTLFEVHEWKAKKSFPYLGAEYNGVLTITRIAYESNSANVLGSKMTSFERVEEWADLEPVTVIKDTSRLWVVPLEINNNEAVFNRVIELMRLLDENDAAITREIYLKEAKVFGSSDIIEHDKHTGKITKLPDDFYISFDNPNNKDIPLNIYSPDIRIRELKERSEMIKRQIESVLSLSNGFLSEPIAVKRTATEVMHGNKEFSTLIKSIQDELKKSLTILALVMDEIAAYNKLPHGIKKENVIFDKPDNILETEEERFAKMEKKINIMKTLQSINVISSAEIRAAFIKYADFMPTEQEVSEAQQSLPQKTESEAIHEIR